MPGSARPLRLVLDTNVLVSSLSSKSASHWLVRAMRNGLFELTVTTDILLEYEEVLGRKYSPAVAIAFIAGLQELPTTLPVTVYYRWQLLADPDDDKFVEAALTADADYIVSEDAHFRPLARVEFPNIQVLTLPELRTKFGALYGDFLTLP